MKLSLASAAVFLALPFPTFAATGYFCQLPNKVGAKYPTYDCGVKCGLSGYNTQFETYHCWVDKDGAKSCFKTCCEKKGREVGTLRGI